MFDELLKLYNNNSGQSFLYKDWYKHVKKALNLDKDGAKKVVKQFFGTLELQGHGNIIKSNFGKMFERTAAIEEPEVEEREVKYLWVPFSFFDQRLQDEFTALLQKRLSAAETCISNLVISSVTYTPMDSMLLYNIGGEVYCVELNLEHHLELLQHANTCLVAQAATCNWNAQTAFENESQAFYNHLCARLCDEFKVSFKDIRTDFSDDGVAPFFGEQKELFIAFCETLVGNIPGAERACLKRDGHSIHRIALILMRISIKLVVE